MPVNRFTHKTRKIRSALGQLRWRNRVREKTQKKARTPADKTRRDQAQETKKQQQKAMFDARTKIWKMAKELHDTFGNHSAEYYHHLLMQSRHAPKNSRKVSMWNAFVSRQTKAMNETEVEEGQPRLKAHQRAAAIKALWDNMSPDECLEAVKDKIDELTEQRETKKYGAQNVAINRFHDSRVTISHIQSTIESLHHRTGTEFLVFGARSSHDDYMRPYVLSTSRRVEDFFQATTQDGPTEFALKMEAFCLAGLDGVIRNCQQEIIDLKHQASTIVLEKLCDCARPDFVAHMYYKNFDQHITQRFGVVIIGWPLSCGLKAPGDLNSRVELKLIITAFDTGTTQFKRLTPAELDARMRQEELDQQTLLATTPRLSPTPDDYSATTMTLSTTMSDPSSPAVTATPMVLSDALAPAANSAAATMSTFSIVSGDAPQNKPRKVRSDKGTKRGSRSKAQGTTATSAA